MAIRLLVTAEDLALYNEWIQKQPEGTLWQSLEWKTYQEAIGRTVRIYVDIHAEKISGSALVVIDRTTGGYTTWDIPRGPIGSSALDLLTKIIADAKQHKCLSIFLSPASDFHSPIPTQQSARHEQPEATRILDLTLSEEDLLKQMHPKGRYNTKVAEKNGVRVDESADIDAYAKMASLTAKRDGFRGGSTKRYKAFLETISGSFLLLAYAPSTEPPIAGLIGVMHGKTAIYYYGASDHAHRALMAPYLLQWEAIKKCKTAGCTSYDFLGIAPVNTSAVPHPWAGISDFKAKFGGMVVTYPPEQEIVLRPVVKGLLKMKRRILG